MEATMQKNLSYRKLAIFLGVLVMLTGSIVYAWSIFVAPLMELHGWERTQVAYVGNVAFCFNCLGGYIAGILRDKLGAKKIIAGCGILMMIGCVLSANATSPLMIYVTYGVLLGFSVGAAYNLAMFGVGVWWPDAKATAMAITLCFWGGAPAFLAPLMNGLIEQIGVNSVFYFEAVLFGGAMLVAGLLWRDAPDGWNPFPEKVKVAPSAQRNYYLPQAIRTTSFWMHFIAMAIYPGLYMCMNSLLVDFGTSNGMSAAAAAMIVTVVSAAQLVFRFAWGPLEDKIGVKPGYWVHLILFVLGGIGMILFRGNTALLMVAFFIYGGGFGAVSISNPAMALDVWGPKAVNSVFGLCLLGWAPAQLIFPMIGYNILDNTGSYTYFIIYGLALTVIGGFCALFGMRPINPNRFPVTEEEHTK